MRISDATVLVMLTTMLVVPPCTVAADSNFNPSPVAADAVSGADRKAPRSSRLRFRSNGPACMCVNGLSDAEISAAERQRRESAADPQRTIQAP